MKENGANAFVYSKNHNFKTNKDIGIKKKKIKGEECSF